MTDFKDNEIFNAKPLTFTEFCEQILGVTLNPNQLKLYKEMEKGAHIHISRPRGGGMSYLEDKLKKYQEHLGEKVKVVDRNEKGNMEGLSKYPHE